MRIPVFLLFIILPLLLPPLTQAQPELRFSTLVTEGDAPNINNDLIIENGRLIGLRVDAIAKRVHWIHNNTWYRLDLVSRQWTRHPIDNQFDLHFPRWDVVPGTLELRAWDNGVGRVYRVDSNGVGSRIDQSFNHNNQFRHIHHLKSDGNLIAVGGNGLFHPKNFGIQFSLQSKGWHRIVGADIVSTDPYLRFGYSIFDPLSDELVIISLFGDQADPVNPGILTINTRDGRIRLRHKDLPLTFERMFRSLEIPSISAVHTGSHRMAFIHGSTNFIGASPSVFHVLDLDTYNRSLVNASISNDVDYNLRHMALFYDDSDSTLYSVDWYHHTMDGNNTLGIMTAKVDVARLHSLVEEGIEPLRNQALSPWIASAWRYVLLMLLGLFIGLWIRQRNQSSNVTAHNPLDHSSKLTLTSDPLLLNGRTWEDLFDGNYPLEAQLLTLLAKAAENGTPIVSSDTIDRVLIPNHPSPDFIRKIRNQTRKRLEESLQNILPTSNNQPYILIDRDVLDKRKTKLQLNLTVVDLTPPG
jgi:hypothetical protein